MTTPQHSVFTRVTLASAGISCRHVSVCLSQVGVLMKRLNVGSRNNATRYPRDSFSDVENLGKTQMGSPPTETTNAGGVD